MSQTKAQLVAPVGVVTATAMNVSGVLTATTLDGSFTGSASSITQGKNLNVGVVTASGIAGDITGSATSITQGTNVTFGSLTASRLVGNLTGDAVGNALGDALSATVSGITTSNNISAGVVTSTDFRGDGANITGVPAGPVTGQTVAITSATTSVDLSNGNLIYMNQSADTTISFDNPSNGYVYIVRTDDNSGTERTITWPTGIGWSGGSAPTLVTNKRTSDGQVFQFVTRDNGVTWDAKEVMKSDPQTHEMWLSGKNYYGEFGINVGEGPGSPRSSPIQMGGSNWARSMVAHHGSTTWGGVKTDGTAWFAGLNNSGQYNQDKIYRSSPVQMGTDTNWSYINCTPSQAMAATKTDGTLWCWGTGGWGQNGQNDRTNYSSPMQVPGAWSGDRGKLKLGQLQTTAIKANGTLWSMGYNKMGVLGLNTTCPGSDCYFSSPVQVGTDTSWQHVLGGHNSTNAIKTDGTLWVWGSNEAGQLGLNAPDNSHQSSPTQIPGTTWAWASGAEENMMATKTDGTLWVWGNNQQGALGLNQAHPVKISSPTQIPGTWALKEFSSINNAGMSALKQDGTAWAWGYAGHGELGNNSTAASKSSPVQIPGTSWSRIDGNPYQAICILKAV